MNFTSLTDAPAGPAQTGCWDTQGLDPGQASRAPEMDRWKEFRRLVVRRGLSPRLKRTGVHDRGAPVEEVGGGGHRRKRDRLGEDAIGGAVAAQSKVQLGP